MKLFLLSLLPMIAAAQSVAIDAGSAADASFIGGTPYTDAAMTDPNLRYGYNGAAFAYSIPIPNGLYKVTLTIFEPNKTAAAQRIFNVWANGQNLTAVDPFAAGAINKQHPAVIQLLVIVQAGVLRLDFKPVLSNPLISSIAVEPWLVTRLSDIQPGPIVKGSVKVGPFYVDVFTVVHDDDPSIKTKCVPTPDGQCPAAVQK